MTRTVDWQEASSSRSKGEKFLLIYIGREGIFRGGENIIRLEPELQYPQEEVYSVDILKVSAQSKPKSVAGALAAVLREKGLAEMQAVGAGAVNQAVKAIAITRGFVAPNGIDLVCIPAFAEIEIDGEERTAIKFIVEPR